MGSLGDAMKSKRSSKARNLGRRERPGERVLQKTGPDPFSRPGAGDREASQDHQGNRMPGDALAQPLRRILVSYVPERQRVEADNLVLRESEIGLRAVGKLACRAKRIRKRFNGSLP